MNGETPKPTPTQAELDAHARGETIVTHEADGSPEQNILGHGLVAAAVEAVAPAEAPPPPVVEEKAAEPEKERSTYKTRRSRSEE